jgi:superfamily II DNA or RNA helicase
MEGQFLTNYSEVTFLEKIKDSLKTCDAFYFSVSFIKRAGLILILDSIKEALERGVKGKLITSTYQNFTDTASLECFLNLSIQYDHFECHLDHQSFGDHGFHSKGYLFEYKDYFEIVVGSTNITRYALQKNIEWNVSIVTKEKNHLINDALMEFNELWIKTKTLNRDIINNYIVALDYAIEKWDMDYIHSYTDIKPNYMQKKALKEIRRYRDMGVDRALVVAATGSGKTYLAAFDARNFDAKKLLFIVHRDTILKEALQTFRKVNGDQYTYGIFTGTQKELDSDYLFATNTMMARSLERFSPDNFDYIVVDEVHHAVADTYKSIIDYFNPQFLLGLTATPERMDNQSVFDIFEKNVPYELRLRDALLNDLIVPFKYFGIRDEYVYYDEKDVRSLTKQLTSVEHCEFVADEIEKYKPTGKLKAIGFCRNIDHARQMAEAIESLGYNTTYLIGGHNTGERIRAFKDLQDESHPLEIIFAVDILNEGVDLPGINMVLFLRPTESSTIFIQQLGRGLRKYEGKDFLTVLDFIGNSYKRSVQIAMALGTLSSSSVMEKALLKDLVRDDFKALDLPIEIHIDELSKEEILNYIEFTNFNRKDFLIQDYKNFKSFIKSPQYPSHMDYLNNDAAPDIMRFINSKLDGKKNRSYYNFLLKAGEDVPTFTEDQIAFIDYLSNQLPLVRPYEFIIVKELIENNHLTKIELENKVKEYCEIFKINQFDHALKNLQNEFGSENEKDNNPQYVINRDDNYYLNIDRTSSLFIEHVQDLIEYGLTRYGIEFGEFEGDLKLYSNYTTEQFMMSICESTLVYYKGTKVEEDGKVYILANLKKDESTADHLNYKDHFINEKVFQWESQTGHTLTNNQGLKLINSKIAHVFIRKVKTEDGITLPFTYIGTGTLTNPRESDNPNKSLLFDVILDQEIPSYLRYDFKVSNNS